MRAGIAYALTEAMDEGHCGLPADELEPLVSRLLEVPDDPIRTALDLELAEGTVVADTVADTPCVFLGGLYRAEREIAGRLSADVPCKPPGPFTPNASSTAPRNPPRFPKPSGSTHPPLPQQEKRVSK